MLSFFKQNPLKKHKNSLHSLETLFQNLSLDFQHSGLIGSKQRHTYGPWNVTFLNMARTRYTRNESLVLRKNGEWLGSLSMMRHGTKTEFKFTLPEKTRRNDEINALIQGLEAVLQADNELRNFSDAA